MNQNDELNPSSPSSHFCAIQIRSQIRLYSSPSPKGTIWFKLKESRNFSDWEIKLSWVEISSPSLKVWQLVPNHNWNHVEGTSVPPERAWHWREELQIRTDEYRHGWRVWGEGAIRKTRIIYLLTNNCNPGKKGGRREENQWRDYSFPSRSWRIFSEQNTATFEMNIWTLFV